MKRRTVIWGLCAGGLVVASLLTFLLLRPWEKKNIRIGAVISLTGPASHLVDVRDGMALAVSRINHWGGINGREIELIVRDSRSDPEQAKQAIETIEKESEPLFYVSTNSSTSMMLAPLAERYGVVLVGLVVAAGEFTKQNPWCYRYYSLAEDEAQAILFILDSLKVRTLGILCPNDAFGEAISSVLKKEFETSGRRSVLAPFSPTNPDWEADVPKVSGMQAVYVMGFVQHEEQAITALRKAGYAGHILGASGVATLAGKPHMDGVYVAAPLIYSDNFVFATEVKEDFASVYGRPLTHQAASGYDLVKLIAGLLEGRDLSREEVRSLLEKGFVYPGIFGEVELEPGKRDIRIPLHPGRIVNGKIEFLR